MTIAKVKEEMVTMYKIIMNDADETVISKDQPLVNMVRFNIGIMLLKFKAMSDSIINLKEDNEEIQFRLDGMTCDRDQKAEDADKLYEENEKLKEDNKKLLNKLEKLKGNINLLSYKTHQ